RILPGEGPRGAPAQVRRPSGEVGMSAVAPPPEARVNPLREESVTLKAADPCTFIVFGASGDLTHRKLIPALFRLSKQRALHPRTAIVGFARRDFTSEAFREEMRRSVEETESPSADWERFAETLFYVSGVFEDEAAFHSLGRLLN